MNKAMSATLAVCWTALIVILGTLWLKAGEVFLTQVSNAHQHPPMEVYAAAATVALVLLFLTVLVVFELVVAVIRLAVR